MAKRYKSQPRIPGISRIPTGSSVIPKLKEFIKRDARLQQRSASYIVATILSDFYYKQSKEYREEVMRIDKLINQKR